MDGILIVSKRLNGKLDRTVNKEHWAVDLTFMQLLAYSHLIHERMDCHHRSSNVQIKWALCSIFVIKSLKLPLILNAFALLTLAFMHSVLVRVAAHTHFSPQPALNRQIHYQRLSYPRPSTFNKKKEKILRSLFIRCQLNTHTHTHHVHQPKKGAWQTNYHERKVECSSRKCIRPLYSYQANVFRIRLSFVQNICSVFDSSLYVSSVSLILLVSLSSCFFVREFPSKQRM